MCWLNRHENGAPSREAPFLFGHGKGIMGNQNDVLARMNALARAFARDAGEEVRAPFRKQLGLDTPGENGLPAEIKLQYEVLASTFVDDYVETAKGSFLAGVVSYWKVLNGEMPIVNVDEVRLHRFSCRQHVYRFSLLPSCRTSGRIVAIWESYDAAEQCGSPVGYLYWMDPPSTGDQPHYLLEVLGDLEESADVHILVAESQLVSADSIDCDV